MAGETNGLATALALALESANSGVGADTQADFFEAEAPMPVSPVAVPTGGRPKGARNRSTEAFRDHFLRQYRHPMMVLGAMYSRSTRDLAEELELYRWVPTGLGDYEKMLDTGAAATLQAQAATSLLPYLTQKLPVAVEIKTEETGTLNVFLGAAPAAGQHEQNQSVINGVFSVSEAAKSDEQPKLLEEKDIHDATR